MLQGKEGEVVTLPRPAGLCCLMERHKNEDLKTIFWPLLLWALGGRAPKGALPGHDQGLNPQHRAGWGTAPAETCWRWF